MNTMKKDKCQKSVQLKCRYCLRAS